MHVIHPNIHWFGVLCTVGTVLLATRGLAPANITMSVHFDLPVAAHHAVRYNWLLNVTSRPGKFHAVDWCVELHNLEIKVRQCTQEHQILTSIG